MGVKVTCLGNVYSCFHWSEISQKKNPGRLVPGSCYSVAFHDLKMSAPKVIVLDPIGPKALTVRQKEEAPEDLSFKSCLLRPRLSLSHLVGLSFFLFMKQAFFEEFWACLGTQPGWP